MILGKILVLLLLSGCDNIECMEDYYNANKDDLIAIRGLSQTLDSNYEYQKITIRQKDGELEVMFIGGTVDNVTMYIGTVDHSLLAEYPTSKCSSEVLERFRTMYNDTTLREILQLFTAIEPNAIRMNSKGVFLALGETLKHPNKNLEGGVFMSFEPGFSSRWVTSEIDTNVYLYDALVY